jgi:hypothetical protein
VQFGLADSGFSGLLAGRAKEERVQTPGTGDTTEAAMATEFDGPWPHPFVKGNIGALEYFFPEAVKKYADLIDSIRSGTASEECRLYMQNVDGNSESVGHMLAYVSEDTVKVLDIASGGCKNTTEGKMFRFLFRYCGKLDRNTEIVHVMVDVDIPVGRCTALKNDGEWLSD